MSEVDDEQAYADMMSEEANAILASDRRWIRVEDRLPEHYDFYWVLHRERKVDLAYFVPPEWQTAESAGDREGLSVEAYTSVTHWAELDPPEPPSTVK